MDPSSKPSPGRILVAEDDPFFRQILAKRLRANGHEVVACAHGEEAWTRIRESAPEVVVTDWMMPRLDGLDLCRRIKAHADFSVIYCILLTAKDRLEDRVSALDLGADDYLLKPCEDAELLARVRAGLRVHRLHVRLEEASITDVLTGLGNRRAFDRRLDEEIARARRYLTALSVVVIDLDDFKRINDRLGHPVGDEVLMRVARALRDRTRTGELAARIGGDEFALLLPNTDLEGARAVAEAIEGVLDHLAIPALASAQITCGGSAGAAQLDEGDDASALVRAADRALYARKQERGARGVQPHASGAPTS